MKGGAVAESVKRFRCVLLVSGAVLEMGSPFRYE